MPMEPIRIARPAAGEYAASFEPYVSRVDAIEDAPLMLSRQLERFARRIEPLTDAAAEYRYAPAKWSIKEIVGHLSDSERIFGYRLLRIGRGDTTPLPPFDENAYVPAAQCDRRRVSDLLDEWRTVRMATMSLVRSMPDNMWARRGTVSNNPITARALPYII